MVDDKPDDAGATPEPERPKREPPTLDLEAIEISDETRQAEAADAAAQPTPKQPSRFAPLMTSALVSAMVGAAAAGLVLWAVGWPHQAPAPPAPAPAVNTAALNTLTARLDKLESRPAAAPAGDTAALDALAARLANVEAKTTAPAPPVAAAPDPALPAQVGELEKSVAALRDQVAEARAQSDKAAAAVNEVKSAPRDIPPPPDLSPLNARIAANERAVKAVSAEVAQRKAAPPDDPQLRRAVAASLLEVSVRSGEPYATALAAAKTFAANPDALKPLDAFAAGGVPNTDAMDRELLALLPKLSPAHETSTTGSGIVDRLQAGAARLVRIERTDAVSGNDRAAIVARASAAAQRNDVAEARRELKTLAPADRAAAQAWIDKADARDAALAASRQFASEAMAALTKPAQ